MSPLALKVLLIIFLTHLAVFIVLGIRRRQAYYFSLAVTFVLLSLVTGFRLTGINTVVVGMELEVVLRAGALLAAAVSLSWTATRVWRRVRDRRGRTARIRPP